MIISLIYYFKYFDFYTILNIYIYYVCYSTSYKIFYIFFSNFQIIPLPYQARNTNNVDWLWKVSEKWTKVNENIS